MSIDGIGLYPQVIYLNKFLAGGRIDKVCQPNKYDLYIYVRQPGKTYILYISIDPQCPLITITQVNPDNPPEPTNFCMLLRKQIEGGRIGAINQVGLDRIINIEIDAIGSKGGLVTKNLIVELVGNYANIILVQDGYIMDALRKVGNNNNRVRTIIPGYDYILPPSPNGANCFTEEDVLAGLQNFPGNLYQGLLNSLLGFGPLSIREIIYRAGLDKDKECGELNKEELSKLGASLEDLKREIALDKGSMVLENPGKLKVIAPFNLEQYHHHKNLIIMDNYNDLLELYRSKIYTPKIPNQAEYLKIIHNEENRLRKKIKVLTKELQGADKAEEFKIKADILMTYQYQITDAYAKVVELPNIYSETGEKVKIALDNRYSIMDNVQKYYKKYEKLKRSKGMISQQIAIAKEDLAYAGSVAIALEHCVSLVDLEDIKNEMIKARFLKLPKKKQMAMAKSKPYKFQLPNGMDILVGKNNIQNDYLSFKVAKNEDIWLHTKDIPGSHVVIITNGEQVDDYNLGLAAQIAIYFSQGRDSTNVQVDYLKKKYLKKPSGAKPGYTIFTNNRTIFATVDEDEIYPIIKK